MDISNTFNVNILKGLSWKTCLVSLVYKIAVSKYFDDHSQGLSEIFQRLLRAILKPRLSKCCLFNKEVR